MDNDELLVKTQQSITIARYVKNFQLLILTTAILLFLMGIMQSKYILIFLIVFAYILAIYPELGRPVKYEALAQHLTTKESATK